MEFEPGISIPTSGPLLRNEVVGICPHCGREVIVAASLYSCKGFYDKRLNKESWLTNKCLYKLSRRCLKRHGKEEISPDEMRSLLKGDAIWLPGMDIKGVTYDRYGMLWASKTFRWFVHLVSPITLDLMEQRMNCKINKIGR